MTKTAALLSLCAFGVALGGCVAFPVGGEEFRTEYAAEIRAATEPPTKEYEPLVSATSAPNGHVDIGLAGDITVVQPQVQHYRSVSLTKRKILAVGFFPSWAEEFCSYVRPTDALRPMKGTPYVGNGKYTWDEPPTVDATGFEIGRVLNALTLTSLAAPLQFAEGLFGPFAHEWHYLGRQIERENYRDIHGVLHVNRSYSSRDLDLLEKFSAADRKRIGAWTYRDDDEHPQNTFWHGLTAVTLFPWPGISKFCTYVVHEPVELEKTTPAGAKTTVSRKAVAGPYGVFLQIPDAGFVRTLTVPRGETSVRFDLSPAGDGLSDGQAYVRFLPPSGGLEEAWDDDARAMLESVAGIDMPVALQLPVPKLSPARQGR